MRICLSFALALGVAFPAAPLAAQSWTDDEVRIRVREVLRDARMVVRTDTREAGRAVRDAMRHLRSTIDHVRRHAHRSAHEHHDFALGGWFGQATSPTDNPCDDRRGRDRGERHCEVREERLAAFAGTLTVDASPNGGIRVEAWDESDILVRAIVNAQAETEADARRLATEVQVQTGGGRITATGPAPRSRPRESWHVSYRVYVPARTDLDLNTRNGGIGIRGVQGNLRFDATNGGVTLTDVGGDVRGRTRNGGLTVALGGSQWEGAGLDVETTNGGVNLAVPDGYSAELTARTVNGGLRSEVPLTVQGRLDREINSTLGSGGPPVKVRTTNGGLRITRR